MLSLARVDELMSHLRVESAKAERFATRFILLQGCQAWDELIPKLTFEVDRVIRLSEFCSGADVFPDLERLRLYLRKETAGCRSILLIPLAECIRLDPEFVEAIQLLAEWPSHSMRRIYVPLLAAEEFFFKGMNRVSRFRAGELPEPWSLKGEGTSEIIAAPFSVGATGRLTAEGIKEYLTLWEKSSVRKAWLVTAMAPSLPALQTRSECRVRIYPSSFDYVRRNIDWEELREEWGSPQQWEWLAAQVQGSDSFDLLAGRLLNFAEYDADKLFALWTNFDQHARWLVWLWSKRRSKPGTYIHYVLKDNNNVDDLSHDAIMTIFALQRSLSFSRERKELLKRLGVNLMPVEFWERYNEMTDPLDRVAVLTDLSEEEREKLVLCAGELVTKYSRNLWWDYLEVAFPALTWYLQPADTGDEFAGSYFSAYNRCRLKDQPDEELTTLITRWANEQLLWNYPARSDLLAKQRAAGAKIVWVDAMGAEWTGLLTRILAQDRQVDCEVKLAKSCLPTITEANREWESDQDVERRLDDIAHHYAYEFPRSFLKSIGVIQDVARKALALLSKYPTVVITSDHGLSRFAATSSIRVSAPEESEVEYYGRYSRLRGGTHGKEQDELWAIDKDTVVLLTHSRFKGGGACQGEVHGGATPEEYLTPVITIRRKNADTQMQFEVISPIVKLNPKGDGILTVRCNRKVGSIELRVAGHVLLGQSGPGFTWVFSLNSWKAGEYTGKLYSGNQLVGEISFEVVKGLIQGDLGL